MTFERTHDLELVRGVMTHPRIWRFISDDGSPEAGDFTPSDHPSVWYMKALDGAEFLGIWMFVPQTSVCFEVHTCLLPSAWGPRATQAAREMAEWMWANSPALRIVTSIPVINRLAIRLARNAGFTEYGRDPQSYQRDGMLWDRVLMGVSKG